MTSRAMQVIYSHGFGLSPCTNTVLIVDEVDDLIVDKSPNDHYGLPHSIKSQSLTPCFGALTSNNPKPPSIDYKLWQECKLHYKHSMTMEVGKDYCFSNTKNGRLFVPIVNGKPNENAYKLWVEYLRYKNDNSYKPVYKNYYFVQNMPHLINAYDCILGLSGTLGSPSEQDFLKEVYKCESYITPSFLDTCLDFNRIVIGKKVPQIHEVYIMKSQQEQFEKVINLAAEKCKCVPVLLICDTKINANCLYTQTLATLGKLNSLPLGNNRNINDFVQIFTERDEFNNKMDSNLIVHAATEKFPDTTMRRITITDPYGGRGFDFDVRDDEANDHGGLLVCALTIPGGRDWIQWK
jgi:hypothetical protein